jgi:hypothetical protein
MKYLKLICTDPMTGWKEVYFCEKCLNNNHSNLLKDWFIKCEKTNKKECQSYAHKRNNKELLK